MLGAFMVSLAWLMVSTPGSPGVQAPAENPSSPALVIAVRGEVSGGPSARGERPGLRMLDLVAEGTSMRLGKGSRIDLLFGDRWLTFEGSGDLKLQRNRWLYPDSVKRTRNLTIPSDLPEPGFEAWTGTQEPAAGQQVWIDSPRETAIRDLKPTLRWRSERRRETVRLDLLTVVQGRLELVESWRGLRGRELQVYRALTPERPYMWRVSNEGEEPRSFDQAWFIVRGPKKMESLSAWIRALEALRSKDDEDRQVAESLLAIGLERAGLLAEARSSWQALASQGRVLEVASERVELLKGRQLVGPRISPMVPLPFRIRLDDLEDDPGASPAPVDAPTP